VGDGDAGRAGLDRKGDLFGVPLDYSPVPLYINWRCLDGIGSKVIIRLSSSMKLGSTYHLAFRLVVSIL